MTECEKLRNDLKAFLDGQLSPAARIAMRLHLNRCESCRKEIEEMRLLGTNMRTADSLEMSDALRSRILASVPTSAPPATVKMIPKWREKPVLIWGASASAVLAWFVLYPAMNDYQNHVSHSAKTATNNGQTALTLKLYTQDYDDTITAWTAPRWRNDLPNGVAQSGPTASQRWYKTLYKDGKNDVVPPWMTRRLAPSSLQGRISSGPAPGDSAVTRQTEIVTKADPVYAFPNADPSRQYYADYTGAFRNPTNQASANEGIRNGMPKSNSGTDANQLDVLAGGRGGERADRRYIAPSEVLLVEGVQNNMDIHSTHGTLKPSEKFETDPSRSGQSQFINLPTAPQETFHIGHGYYLDDLPTERQVHKEASLTVEVANAEQQSEAVERLVKESKGYVAQNQLTTVEDNTRQASLICKVPVDQFDTVMGQLARLGLLKGKTLSGEDITDKVIDEQETGHVLRADIATTEEKLKERKRHSDAVRDEETLRQLRIRVAQSQARLKMLTKLGALSQITVELDEKPKNAAPEVVKPANPFLEEVSGTGQAAAHSFLMALRLPVQLLVWIVVYSPLWALLIYGYRRMTR